MYFRTFGSIKLENLGSRQNDPIHSFYSLAKEEQTLEFSGCGIIIAPTSALDNWTYEIHKFSKEQINTVVLSANSRNRAQVIRTINQNDVIL